MNNRQKTFTEQLLEYPGRVSGSEDFGMDGPRNRRLATTLSGEILHDDENGKIVFSETTVGSHEGVIALIGKRDNLIHYFVQFEVVSLPLTGRTVTQVQLWRDQKASGAFTPGNINMFIFFEVLLPRFHTIMSDTLQTGDGIKFWERMMYSAQAKKLHIAMADFVSGEIHSFSGGDLSQWFQDMEPWGPPSTHKSKRLIISSKPI